MNCLNEKILPVDVVFHPSWWFKNSGITFDEDFFFHPAKRVGAEQKMEQVLYDRFGQYGLGENHDKTRPVVGAVHNAAGYLISAMLGCELKFNEDAPPEVIAANRDNLEIELDAVFKSDMFKRFENLCDELKKKYGYLIGDVNWSGVLNLALDLRGQLIFLDMLDKPDEVKKYFSKIVGVMERFTQGVEIETGSSSISVNNIVQHFDKPVFLHSECSVTMISGEQYDEFLLPIDREWSKSSRPYGIHFCGNDPHRFAASFAKLPHLDFLDVGWGGDLNVLRQHLPDTFLNIRLSPVEIAGQVPEEIRETITKLVADSGNPFLTGICCVNMDDKVTDEQVSAIFETVFDLRQKITRDIPK
jgi:hypothetical protein